QSACPKFWRQIPLVRFAKRAAEWSMRAIVVREFGGPEVLRYEEVPTPMPGPGEVLIHVHAVSVNRTLDLMAGQGGNPRDVTLPLVLGVDPTGEVAALGPGGAGVSVGDCVGARSSQPCGTCASCRAGGGRRCPTPRMLGVHRWGGYAE